MRLREFQHAVQAEFGDRGDAILHDLVLGPVGGMTARAAIDAGVPIARVWQALCEAMDVPVDRRHGVGLPDPRR